MPPAPSPAGGAARCDRSTVVQQATPAPDGSTATVIWAGAAQGPARSPSSTWCQRINHSGRRRRAVWRAEQHERVALLRRRPLVLRRGDESAVGDRAASGSRDDPGALVVSLADRGPGQCLAKEDLVLGVGRDDAVAVARRANPVHDGPIGVTS